MTTVKKKRKKKMKPRGRPFPKKPKVKIVKKKRINSRQKGKAGELEFANFLRERGISAHRGQQFKGGTDSPDVVAKGCLHDVHIEVKRKETGNVYEWLDQACGDADLCKMPVVAHRRNNQRWIAIMDFRDYLTIMEFLYDARKAILHRK